MLNDLNLKLEKAGETFFKIKVRPSANKTEIKKILEDGTIKMDLNTAPVRGKANIELVHFLSSYFSIPEKNVKIISGLTSKIKLIRIYRDL